MFDRKKAAQELLRRTAESFSRREGDILAKYLKPEVEIPFWVPKPTKDEPHIIDIIPFVSSGNHPLVDHRNPIKKGDIIYWVESYVHPSIGPSKEWFLCPAKCYGKPCPICEYVAREAKAGAEWDDLKSVSPKRRCLYNIVCYDSEKEEAKGVQVWEVSHNYAEGPIQMAAKNPRGGGIVPFADVDAGKSISFEVANDTYNTIQGHKLLDRDYVISDKILAQALILDDLLVLKDYDYISQVFHQGSQSPSGEPESGERDNKQTRKRGQVSSPATAEAVCSFGGTFGASIDLLPECSKCQDYNECADEADLIEARAAAQRKPGQRMIRQR